MQISAEYTCGYCGEVVETTVDASAGSQQSYVEDCAVCCKRCAMAGGTSAT